MCEHIDHLRSSLTVGTFVVFARLPLEIHVHHAFIIVRDKREVESVKETV